MTRTLFKTINMRDFLNKFSKTDDSVQEDFSYKVYNYIQSNTGSGSSESYLKESYDKMISSEFENESWYVNEKFFTNNSSQVLIHIGQKIGIIKWEKH